MIRWLPIVLRQRQWLYRAVQVTPNVTLTRPVLLRTNSTQPLGDSTWSFFKQFNENAAPDHMKRSAQQIWESNSRVARDAISRTPIANAYTGRSVKVVNGNVADAFRRLDQCLSRNKVRYELKLAERHEKKGDKRRRLESERWRIRFANEVRKKVALVKAIRRRGA